MPAQRTGFTPTHAVTHETTVDGPKIVRDQVVTGGMAHIDDAEFLPFGSNAASAGASPTRRRAAEPAPPTPADPAAE